MFDRGFKIVWNNKLREFFKGVEVHSIPELIETIHETEEYWYNSVRLGDWYFPRTENDIDYACIASGKNPETFDQITKQELMQLYNEPDDNKATYHFACTRHIDESFVTFLGTKNYAFVPCVDSLIGQKGLYGMRWAASTSDFSNELLFNSERDAKLTKLLYEWPLYRPIRIRTEFK